MYFWLFIGKFTLLNINFMTFSAVKEKLHGYIENADQNKVMAIYTLIENDLDEGGSCIYK